MSQHNLSKSNTRKMQIKRKKEQKEKKKQSEDSID
jgi:hypothetical protein